MQTISFTMKNTFILFSFLLTCSIHAQDKIFISGCNWSKVALLDKKTKAIEWSYDLAPNDECENISLTKDGNLLFSYKKGAKLIKPNKEVIWDYKVEGGELFTATQLKDGGYLLAHSGKPAKIIELNKKGEIRRTIEFDTEVASIHGQFRQIIKSKKGTYLIPIMAKSEVVEIDKNGKELLRFKAEGNLFSIIELKNGNLMVGCGDAHCVLEVERETGKIVNKITEINGAKLNFIAEIIELNNGNLLICNWNGHAKGEDRKEPILLEIDNNKNIVWQISEGNDIGKISCAHPVYNAKKVINFKNH